MTRMGASTTIGIVWEPMRMGYMARRSGPYRCRTTASPTPATVAITKPITTSFRVTSMAGQRMTQSVLRSASIWLGAGSRYSGTCPRRTMSSQATRSATVRATALRYFRLIERRRLPNVGRTAGTSRSSSLSCGGAPALISWPPSRALRWLREAGPRRRDTADAAFGPAPAASRTWSRQTGVSSDRFQRLFLQGHELRAGHDFPPRGICRETGREHADHPPRPGREHHDHLAQQERFLHVMRDEQNGPRDIAEGPQ